MSEYTFSQLEQLWTSNGGNPAKAPIAAAISLAESGGNSQALNNDPATGDYSVGLWQVNYFGSLDGPRTAAYGSPTSLQASPDAQAKAAISISGNGANFTPWTTYTSGKYQQYLNGQSAGAGTPVSSSSSNSSGSSATYTSTVIPGIPDKAPPNPGIGLDPIAALGSQVEWIGEFAGWAMFTLLVGVFGGILFLLGLALLAIVLIGPAAGPVTALVGKSTPQGRLVGLATSFGGKKRSPGGDGGSRGSGGGNGAGSAARRGLGTAGDGTLATTRRARDAAPTQRQRNEARVRSMNPDYLDQQRRRRDAYLASQRKS